MNRENQPSTIRSSRAAALDSTRREASKPAGPSGAGIVVTMGFVLALTVIGDAVAEGLAVPVPGAAIGMMLLASVFAVRGGADPASGRVFDAAAPHFPLFFVPAAAGIVASVELLTDSWLPITAAIVLGTALTLVMTGALAQLLLRRLSKAVTA